jgi:hypothetical protein
LILTDVLVDAADRDVTIEVVGIEIERASIRVDRLLVGADVHARFAEELPALGIVLRLGDQRLERAFSVLPLGEPVVCATERAEQRRLAGREHECAL